MKKIALLIFITLSIAGCASAPSYVSKPNSPAVFNLPGIYHRVEAGQTLWKISKMYDIDMDDILRANRNLELSKIEVGQSIFIPNRKTISYSQVKYSTDDFIWPIKGKVITSFGINYHYLMNKGLNIQPYADLDVEASRSGKVVFSATDFGNFGRVIILDHGDGLRSVYARNSEVYVKVGDIVKQGTIIGRTGQWGREKNNYLHFEIRKGATPQNPLFYLP